MTGRHWFRRDVLFPLLILIFFGYGIYWIWQRMGDRPELRDNKLFYYALITGLVVFAVLALVTIRHAVSSYSLERFNPGNPQSLKRLRKMRRFHLPAGVRLRLHSWVDPTEDITQWLNKKGYLADARTPHGRVFTKPRRILFWIRPIPVDRIFVLQHDLLNVLVIDQIFKDSIRYIKQQNDEPSPRNLLIMVMNRTDDNEAVSAAAGVVNFLGKFNGGTLGVLLLDVVHGRLFYPIDRSLQPRLHRRYLDMLRFQLVHWLKERPLLVRKSGQASSDALPETAHIDRVRQTGNSPQIRQFTPREQSSDPKSSAAVDIVGESKNPADTSLKQPSDEDYEFHSDIDT